LCPRPRRRRISLPHRQDHPRPRPRSPAAARPPRGAGARRHEPAAPRAALDHLLPRPRNGRREVIRMELTHQLAPMLRTLRLSRYTRPDLLVLDDFGLKPLRAPGPEDLYDVINERYERGSILLTSNRDRAEWADLFGEPLLASAALDRLTHGAHFVEITGPS